MRKYFILLLLTVISLEIHAQRIEFDIFRNLKYESNEQRYKAYLKKDIFSNLIFSDNNNNELTFKSKYLDLNHKGVLTNDEVKIDFFRHLMNRYISERGYKASYEVDILGKVIIEDNLNRKVEIGTDIFGNPTYDAKTNYANVSIRRDISGNLEYRSGSEQATLKKDIFNKWSYSDSSGNKFEFSDHTWKKLTHQYASEEDIFLFLINRFLHF